MMQDKQRVHAGGSYLTAFILNCGFARLIEGMGIRMHANERIVKSVRDLEPPTIPFPLVVDDTTPHGEIHFRDEKSGKLLGQIVGIYAP